MPMRPVNAMRKRRTNPKLKRTSSPTKRLKRIIPMPSIQLRWFKVPMYSGYGTDRQKLSYRDLSPEFDMVWLIFYDSSGVGQWRS